MSINILFVQMPLVGEIAGALQSTPDTQQSIAQAKAVDLMQKAQTQVQKTQKQDPTKPVGDEAPNQNLQQHARKRQKRHQEPEQEKQPEQTTTWAGHIINLRI